MSAFGFDVHRLRRPRDGRRATRRSYVLEQGDIRFVVTGALDRRLADRRHVRRHGDGVHDLAWLVDDAAARLRRRRRPRRRPRARAVDRDRRRTANVDAGARSPPTATRGTRSSSAAATAGDLLEPGYTAEDLPPTRCGPTVGLTRIDHVVGNVEQGRARRLGRTSTQTCSGFAAAACTSTTTRSRTEYSALMSTVVWDGAEDRHAASTSRPTAAARARSRSTSSTYDGPGVQHIALRTDDIVATRAARCATGACGSCTVPDTYYDEARERLAGVDLPWDELAAPAASSSTATTTGYLLQIFTETITDRPTVFFEIIERDGATGLRRGQLQGPVRSDRARPGPPRATSRTERDAALPPGRRRAPQATRRPRVTSADGGVLAAEELMGAEGFSGASSLLYHRHVARSRASSPPRRSRRRPSCRAEPSRCSRAICAPASSRGGARPGHRPPAAARQRRRRRSRGRQPTSTSAAVPQRDRRRARLRAARTRRARERVRPPRRRAGRLRRRSRRRRPTGGSVDGASRCELLDRSPRGGHVDVPARYLHRARPVPRGCAVLANVTCAGPTGTARSTTATRSPVLVRHARRLVRPRARHHPFDVVGWDGCLYPWALHIHDFEPIVGRLHQPPPVHQTFDGPGFVVCSFVPRLFDFDPERDRRSRTTTPTSTPTRCCSTRAATS